MFRRLLCAIAVLIAFHPQGTSAQDVEMLGRRYGTRPPDAYYREMARNPDAFRFGRGRAARMREARAFRSFGAGGPLGAPGAGGAGLAAGLGPRDEPVVGDIYVPVVLGLFQDSPTPPPVLQTDVQNGYFGPQPGTVSDYYAEVSNDSIALIGDVLNWVRSPLTQAQATEGISGLGCCGIGAYIKSLLDLQPPGLDWGAYDNDGPDGVPNSGDDDGYVDALAVIHPTAGAECTGGPYPNRIWSHKWTLSDASDDSYYPTGTPSMAAGVSRIRVDDYFVQGALACNGSGLNEIGVFTHELGHAFGLPDLYDTRSLGVAHDGAGTWELMAAGTWGCSGTTPRSPCHLGAWSKAMLGWVTVDTLPPDTDLGTLTLPPVETTGVVYRVDAADGSDEYFLLENRQRNLTTYDQMLPAEGLLIWQIDAGIVDARWPLNSVNAFNHMGVWLRQADGLDELGVPGGDGGDGGDAGDPFPGLTGNTEFHAASNPSATSFESTATGLTVVDIAPAGDDVHLRVLTRFSTLTVTSSGTSPGASGLFTVDGTAVAAPPANFVQSAPFMPRTLVAEGGELVQPGERTPFVQWDDGPASRSWVVVTPLTDASFNASYSGTEYELHVDLTGGVNDVEPGIVTTTPPSAELWFVPSTDVTVTATAQTGFSFLGWTGALAGRPNPGMVTMSAPVLAGADFELVYGVADIVVDLVATVPTNLQLQVENGTSPVSWAILNGATPLGLVVGADGSVSGSALDLGPFPLVLEATDALGLVATAAVTFDVSAPSIPIGRLGNTFLLGSQPLDSIQALFLDHQGNRNGTYDLGDFRAWVLANPTLPLSAELVPSEAQAQVADRRVITLPTRLGRPEEPR